MNREDFDYDQQDFPASLKRAEVGYRRSKQAIVECVEHWQSLAADHLKTIEIRMDLALERVEGGVLGKKFQVQLTPLTVGEDTFALAVLVVVDRLTGGPLEVCRFLVEEDGAVRSLSGDLVLSHEESFVSYRLLIALVRRVLSAAPKA